MSSVQAVWLGEEATVTLWITGTRMLGWVFRQKDRIEMQMKKTEITPINYKIKNISMMMIMQYLCSIR